VSKEREAGRGVDTGYCGLLQGCQDVGFLPIVCLSVGTKKQTNLPLDWSTTGVCLPAPTEGQENRTPEKATKSVTSLRF
jgi:hypothetical protein